MRFVWIIIIISAIFIAPPLSANRLTVALIAEYDGLGDHALNDSAHQGLMAVQQTFGFRLIVEEPDSAGGFEWRRLEETLSVSTIAVVLGISDPQMIYDIGRRFPHLRILHCQKKVPSLPNLRTLVFHREEIAFVAGALSGWATRSGIVGIIDNTVLRSAFSKGLDLANPQAALSSLTQSSGVSPNIENRTFLADDVINNSRGADVFFGASVQSSKKLVHNVQNGRPLAITVDLDPAYIAHRHHLANIVTRLDLIVAQEISTILSEGFEPGVRHYGFKEGAFELHSANSSASANADESLAKARLLIEQIRSAGVFPNELAQQQ